MLKETNALNQGMYFLLIFLQIENWSSHFLVLIFNLRWDQKNTGVKAGCAGEPVGVSSKMVSGVTAIARNQVFYYGMEAAKSGS